MVTNRLVEGRMGTMIQINLEAGEGGEAMRQFRIELTAAFRI